MPHLTHLLTLNLIMARIPYTTLLARAGDILQAAEWNEVMRQLHGWWSVRSYGAIGDGVTDDTSAIQAAINDCHAGGGGIVFFPNGTYLIGGALRATSRAQLEIPLSDNVTTEPCVTLLGESQPNTNLSEGFTTTADAASGAVLHSTIDATQEGDSVIGVAYANYPVFGNFNFTNLRVENLRVIVKSKDASGAHIPATMSGINAYNLAALAIFWTVVRSESDNFNSVLPNTLSTGVLYPHYNNKATQHAEHLIVQGFYNGIVCTEHLVGTRLAVVSCVNGLRLLGADTQHPCTIVHLSLELCVNSIKQESGLEVHIGTYQNERLASGHWNDYQRDILSTSTGTGHVFIEYASATKTAIGPDPTFKATDASLIHVAKFRRNLATTVTAG